MDQVHKKCYYILLFPIILPPLPSENSRSATVYFQIKTSCDVEYLKHIVILFTELKNLFIQHLYNSMLIEDKEINNLDLSTEKSLDQLIPAVLISGFGNLVFRRTFMRRNGRSDFSFINEYEIVV